MKNFVLLVVVVFTFTQNAFAETMRLQTASSDYQVTNVFSNVDFFEITVDIDAPLAVGSFINPEIVSVSYQVTGALAAGTPSGFTAFDLQRTISGDDFYAQGSSLSFEIAAFADLSDGVQADELVDRGFILEFNGREIGNGRFHPALFQLSAGGFGMIQNSNNVPTQDPNSEIAFGAEYVNNLNFDAQALTLITEVSMPPVTRGGSGSLSILLFVMLILSLLISTLRSNVFRSKAKP